MPEISNFNGMSIKMIFRDHEPPHIHVFVGSEESKVDIEGNLIEGRIQKDKLRVLLLWMKKYHKELLENWELAKNALPIERIKPWE